MHPVTIGRQHEYHVKPNYKSDIGIYDYSSLEAFVQKKDNERVLLNEMTRQMWDTCERRGVVACPLNNRSVKLFPAAVDAKHAIACAVESPERHAALTTAVRGLTDIVDAKIKNVMEACSSAQRVVVIFDPTIKRDKDVKPTELVVGVMTFWIYRVRVVDASATEKSIPVTVDNNPPPKNTAEKLREEASRVLRERLQKELELAARDGGMQWADDGRYADYLKSARVKAALAAEGFTVRFDNSFNVGSYVISWMPTDSENASRPMQTSGQ